MPNDLLLIGALVCCFLFGFAAGRWWERIKHEPPPPDEDEIWW